MIRLVAPRAALDGRLGLAAILLVVALACPLSGQDGLDRLLNQVQKIPLHVNSNDSCRVPNMIQEPSPVLPSWYQPPNEVAHQQGDLSQHGDPDFLKREVSNLDPREIYPQPVGGHLNRQQTFRKPPTADGEYVFDGQDKGRPVTVDKTWNVYGLDIEDTIGHFDTLDGQRLVSPSNRVAIYAPRFSAVRKVSDFGKSYAATTPRQFEDERQTVMARGADFSDSTKQFDQVSRHKGTRRASSILDQTRGVLADNTTHLFGMRNSYSPYENLEIIRFGRFSSAEKARLGVGIQSANVWKDDLGLQILVDEVQPVIVNDVYRVEQIETIESNQDNHILRVVKIASRIAARPGDLIEFTIRFDNISSKKIGNVTIIDNLSARLEYVPKSAESSHHSVFITKPNKAGSVQLRWEIRDPLRAGEGGVVRFKCQVR